ncbi:hypothetical protein Axi01nite_18010 [Actinoplanes xinjiangensis]|nr:hypothetical protein Axi01nite_18010 [Actinoplanes xinjiangensis]
MPDRHGGDGTTYRHEDVGDRFTPGTDGQKTHTPDSTERGDRDGGPYVGGQLMRAPRHGPDTSGPDVDRISPKRSTFTDI